MKLKHLFILALFTIGCNSQPKEENNSTQQDSLSTAGNETALEKTEVKETIDSLSLYFEKPVDFYALKKQTEHMQSNGNIRLSNDYFHAVDDKNYVYYDYWAVEFVDKIKGEGCPLSFKVLKPWGTWKESEYATDNEILIGIKSMLNWKGLGTSDFVGMKKTEIVTRFNQPAFVKGECLIYHQNGKILIFNMKNDKVKWFKYFWLKKPVENIDELPAQCFVW